MAIVRSLGLVQRVAPPLSPTTGPESDAGIDRADTYAHIYRTQPNVRTVVDFFSRNIAQLGLHVFRRIADTDRERLSNHQVDRWIRHPNPFTTRYRMFETLVRDLGVYMNAFWAKVRKDGALQGFLRLPPAQVQVHGGLYPSGYVFSDTTGQAYTIAREDMVHFGGYDPENPLLGLSTIETLRQILAEDIAASHYRLGHWRNSARPGMVIQRPKEAGKWNPTQVKEWRELMQAFETGPNAGRTLLLQEGMTAVQMSHSARDSEFTVMRKLTREECAAAYHVPLPMVGILDHATFSNIKEQHKHLYADCLGPWLVMIEEEFERQVLPEADDAENLYVEFNIAEKLKGSFEEQAEALVKLTGRPVMTLNEGRSRINLPRSTSPSADEVLAPLNMSGGEPADPTAAPAPDAEAVSAVLRTHWHRQHARLEKLPADARAPFFARTIERWDRELAADLEPFYGEAAGSMAATINGDTLARLNAGHAVATDRAATVPARD